MAKLKAGDLGSCAVKDGVIVNSYSDFNDVLDFQIIATVEYGGYYIYVPHYIFIKNTVKLDKYTAKKKGIDSRYVDENFIFIAETEIYKIKKVLDGCYCCKCDKFYDKSEPNQPDGTLICWSCRTYPYYK